MCFSICPEWFTELLRTLWLEQEYNKAFKIVDAAFPEMTIEDKLYIVTGRKKLVYAEDTEECRRRSEFKLVGDDWKPSGAFAGMKVASFIDVMEQCQLCADNREAFGLLKEISVLAHSAKGIKMRRTFGYTTSKGTPAGWIAAGDVIELICRLFPTPTNEQWESFWNKYGEAVNEIKQEREIALPDLVDQLTQFSKSAKAIAAEAAPKWCRANATNIDAYLAHERELSERPAPTPDTKLEGEDGWILPDGKFYRCGYMEHIWLAERLGKEEGAAEKSGWIKIHHSLDDRLYITLGSECAATQKQVNTVFDWCEKHKAKLPELAGGKED